MRAFELGDTEAIAVIMSCPGVIRQTLSLYLESNPRRRHCAGVGMAVHDEYQNQGVGSALLAAALDLAESWLGLQRLELTVFVDNAPAIHLYEKFGFALEGTARRFALRDGRYVDAYTMARLATGD